MGRRIAGSNHHLRQRGDRWYLCVRIDGKQRELSLDTESVEAARRKRDKALREIAENRFSHPALGTASTSDTVSKLLALYIEERRSLGVKALHVEARALRHLDAHLGTAVAAKVRPEDVQRALLAMQREPSPLSGRVLTGATPANTATVWRAFFRWMAKRLELRNPCEDVAERAWPEAPTMSDCNRPLTVKQFGQLLTDKRVDLGVRAAIGVTCLCALRMGETLGLRWGDFDLQSVPMPSVTVSGQWHHEERRAAFKEDRKNHGLTKQIPLHQDAVVLLEAWKRAWASRFLRVPTAQDPVFPRPLREEPVFGSHQIWRLTLVQALTTAGLPRVTWHSFKALMADRLHIEAGCSDEELKIITHPFSGRRRGHGSVGRYIRTEFDKRCEYIKRLDSVLREPAPVIPMRKVVAAGAHEPPASGPSLPSDAGTMLGSVPTDSEGSREPSLFRVDTGDAKLAKKSAKLLFSS